MPAGELWLLGMIGMVVTTSCAVKVVVVVVAMAAELVVEDILSSVVVKFRQSYQRDSICICTHTATVSTVTCG